MQFDRTKLKAVILYTCARCEASDLGAVKLHKVLYFFDMLHYALSGAPVIGGTYRKHALGPTCDQLLSTLRELRQEGAIQIEDVDYFGYRKKEYTPLVKVDENRIGGDYEISLLNEIVEFVCAKNTAKTISDFSHQRPWEMAEFGEVIPYHTAFLLFPAEVSLEALEWAEIEGKRIADSRAQSEQVAYTDGAVFRRRLRAARGA
jgi:hypothetical protein